MSSRLVSEPEARSALQDLRYLFIQERNGIYIYRHIEEPGVRVVLDFSQSSIHYQLLLMTLEAQGVNLDAFVAYLDD